jgi:hypothetical protein
MNLTMRHLIAIVHVILHLAGAESGDEPAPAVPCPFASLSHAAGGWADFAHDPISSSHNAVNEEDMILFGLVEAHEVVANEPTQTRSIVMKGQSSRVLHSMADDESNIEGNRRMLKHRGNIHKHVRGRKKTGGTTGNRQKRGNKKTNKRNKRGKRGKRQNNGLGQSAPSNLPRCFSKSTYDSIDSDIAKLKKFIQNDETRSHFLGGIVRLAAHDFMDYDRRDRSNPMGADGCFDELHPTNKGLPESVWCKTCLLRRLYEERYSFLSRADFWIASANAVIRQTSENNALDLKDTFRWGRKDRSSCRGSATRLPDSKNCNDVESTFLTRMGLGWKDAVALLGAHSLGRGSADFSGHEGTWVDTSRDAQRFNKQYYEELIFNAWRPRNVGQENEDWTTGNNKRNERMMLNTDICLVFNLDGSNNCCTKTDEIFQNGQSKCIDPSLNQCPLYSKQDRRWEATKAVVDYVGGTKGSKDNGPFYSAFTEAWRKATTNGWNNLQQLAEDCEST